MQVAIKIRSNIKILINNVFPLFFCDQLTHIIKKISLSHSISLFQFCTFIELEFRGVVMFNGIVIVCPVFGALYKYLIVLLSQ